MKFVEIYKLQNDGSQQTLVTCFWDGGKVSFNGDQIFIQNLKIKGIPNVLNPKEKNLLPADGIRFLEGLKYVFSSGYLNASEVKEK